MKEQTEVDVKRDLSLRLTNRFLGIKKIYYGDWDTEKRNPMYIPSGKPWRTHQIDAKPIPNFSRSLDACIVLLAPKLVELDMWFDLQLISASLEYAVEIRNWGNEIIVKAHIADTAPLAFCQAVDDIPEGYTRRL